MQRQGLSIGFSTGLQLWLFLLLIFFVLGYPAPLSIGLGAIGGLAGGFITEWWNIKDDEKKTAPPPEPESLAGIATSRTRQHKQYARMRHRKKREPSFLGGLFGRR